MDLIISMYFFFISNRNAKTYKKNHKFVINKYHTLKTKNKINQNKR